MTKAIPAFGALVVALALIVPTVSQNNCDQRVTRNVASCLTAKTPRIAAMMARTMKTRVLLNISRTLCDHAMRPSTTVCPLSGTPRSFDPVSVIARV